MSLPGQFVRFAVIGTAAFVVDVGVLYLLRNMGFDLYSARVLSWSAAATSAWLGNRYYTFGVRTDRRWSVRGEWIRYLLSVLAGGFLNYGVYAALVTSLPLVHRHPWLAVATGTLAGMLLNFTLVRRLLYQRT
jgi:putative flippase GtrA